MCVLCFAYWVDGDPNSLSLGQSHQQGLIVKVEAQNSDLFSGSYSGRLSDFDPVKIEQSLAAPESDTREFRVFGSKWGESQEKGTTGGLVSYSFATQNYNGQLRDFDSFITDVSFQKSRSFCPKILTNDITTKGFLNFTCKM